MSAIAEQRDVMFGKADDSVEKSSNENEILCRPQRSSIQDWDTQRFW